MKSFHLFIFFLFFFSYSYAQKIESREANEEISTELLFTPPEFKGGMAGLMKYLRKKVKYPKSARKDKLEGIVYVSFAITEKGIVDSIKITQGIRNDLDNEALRVVNNMPIWTPGKTKEGIPIPTQFTIPIKFNLKSKE